MAQLKADYELLMVFSTKDGDDIANTLKEDFRNRIAENAEITEEEDWGKRRLAYDIYRKNEGYHHEGYYYLVRFNSSPDFPAELERRFGITDGILRFLIINDTEYKIKREKAKAQAKKAIAEAKTDAQETKEETKEAVKEEVTE